MWPDWQRRFSRCSASVFPRICTRERQRPTLTGRRSECACLLLAVKCGRVRNARAWRRSVHSASAAPTRMSFSKRHRSRRRRQPQCLRDRCICSPSQPARPTQCVRWQGDTRVTSTATRRPLGRMCVMRRPQDDRSLRGAARWCCHQTPPPHRSRCRGWNRRTVRPGANRLIVQP